jgi:hypothetical protein
VLELSSLDELAHPNNKIDITKYSEKYFIKDLWLNLIISLQFVE